ncbi:predicted protein [Chaetoceros tenuissimus]|uniref:Uncharacterized protein n=1 Tax=Chaetoceros tenuissimus TaxID=426638 RepID=A0AAD3CX02_9STRA|nr:predicted protein [Chaetoceros tenuissimus]
MISQIKQNRYQRRRLFREDNETTATCFQRILLRSDEQKNKNKLLKVQTSKRRVELMMCTLSNELSDDNGASPGLYVDSSRATRSNLISEGNHDDFDNQREEPSIIQMIDQILSRHDSTKKEKDI